MISHRAYHQTVQDRPLFGGSPAQTYIHKDDSPQLTYLSCSGDSVAPRLRGCSTGDNSASQRHLQLDVKHQLQNSADQPLKLEMAVPPIVAGSKLKP